LLDYIVFDFETTGLDPNAALPIQVAISTPYMKTPFSWFINQAIDIPEESTKVHGITTEKIRSEGISPEDSLRILLEYFGNHYLIVGHNCIRYDRVILEKECERYGVSTIPVKERYRDTAGIFKSMVLNKQILPGESHFDFVNRVLSVQAKGVYFNLKLVTQTLKIPIEMDFHDAAADVWYTQRIFERFCDPFGILNWKSVWQKN